MVFWKFKPTISSESTFTSDVIEKYALTSPTGTSAIRVTNQTATPELKTEICTFLRDYFGDPPHTPILDIPEDKLLDTHDYVFYIRDKEGQLAGTIRYRHTGELLINKDPTSWPTIYRVDGFCIRPDWRKKGVGDYLLTELQRYATMKGQPYAMFLKEGGDFLKDMLSLSPPLYSGVYAYRKITYNKTKQWKNVRIFSPLQAYHMLEWYHRLYPNIFIIRNQHDGQHWRYYKNGYHTILACFQDSYQRIPETGEKMGWCTAWLESSTLTDEIRYKASLEITNTLPSFDYIWINKKWVGNRVNKHSAWSEDGGYFWYTYQWSTNLKVDVSMCALD